jgi:hypothetical protein
VDAVLLGAGLGYGRGSGVRLDFAAEIELALLCRMLPPCAAPAVRQRGRLRIRSVCLRRKTRTIVCDRCLHLALHLALPSPSRRPNPAKKNGAFATHRTLAADETLA